MSLTFKVNDKFRVIPNGFVGIIKGVSFNSIHQEWEYYVEWERYPNQGPFCYVAQQADDLWEKISEIAAGGAGSGYVNQDPDIIKLDADSGPFAVTLPPGRIEFKPLISKQCEHKWVEVGFHHTKTVCYYCDMEKP